ncbi:MAG: ammonia-forming cytochrome c nitrite reductase subunit c552, partial [Propionibacteriaceae bacterium]|nr:ammonia-forming cytochrome c nitrite reductase subunit c552 [Propionibacteriaceae bacterium]
MTELTDYKVRKGVPIWALILIVGAAAVITGVITALIANVAENKGEASVTYIQYDVLTSTSYDPVEWSQNFPRQYKGWAATETFKPTAHAPALVPHEASDVDPRTETASSKLVEDPRLLTLWAGNIFSKDYRHLRGHWYAYTDQNYTLRVLEAPGKGQPAACLNCHASLPGIVDALGNGDREAGWSAMNLLTYAEGKEYADDRPLGCIDCHNPENMELTITRPALVNAMAAMKAEQGIANYDVNRDASVNEMRALICAQCHVEYYFAPDPDPDIFLRVVTFPWKYGLDIDDSWDYYQEINFADFTNTKTGARQLKAQHPEYEIWSTSIHAANGVTCADCHMPYQRVGSQKTSNHEIMSPMANISGTCGACHTASDQVL